MILKQEFHEDLSTGLHVRDNENTHIFSGGYIRLIHLLVVVISVIFIPNSFVEDNT